MMSWMAPRRCEDFSNVSNGSPCSGYIELPVWRWRSREMLPGWLIDRGGNAVSCYLDNWLMEVEMLRGVTWMAHLVVPFHLFQLLLDADVDSYLLTGLAAATEYEVTLAAVYGQQAESDPAVLFESTGEEPTWKPAHLPALPTGGSSEEMLHLTSLDLSWPPLNSPNLSLLVFAVSGSTTAATTTTSTTQGEHLAPPPHLNINDGRFIGRGGKWAKTEWVNASVSQWINQSVSQIMVQSVSQSIGQWVSPLAGLPSWTTLARPAEGGHLRPLQLLGLAWGPWGLMLRPPTASGSPGSLSTLGTSSTTASATWQRVSGGRRRWGSLSIYLGGTVDHSQGLGVKGQRCRRR